MVALRNLARKVFDQEIPLDQTGSGVQDIDILLKGFRQVAAVPVEDGQYEVTVAIGPGTLGQNLADLWKDNRRLGAENEKLRQSEKELQTKLDDLNKQMDLTRQANRKLLEENQRLVLRLSGLQTTSQPAEH